MSSKCHIGLGQRAKQAASFPGDCQPGLLGGGPSVSLPRPPHLPICLPLACFYEHVFHLASWPRDFPLIWETWLVPDSLARLSGSCHPLIPTCDVVETKQGLHLFNIPVAGDTGALGAMKESPTLVTCLVQRDLGVFMNHECIVI